MRFFGKKPPAQPPKRGEQVSQQEPMSLEDVRFMAMAMDITSLMSNENLPANRAYLSSGRDPLNLLLSPSDKASVLCLALAGMIQDDPDYEGAIARIAETIRGNVVLFKRFGPPPG